MRKERRPAQPIIRKIGEYEPVHVRFVDRCGARYAKPNLTARLRRRSVHLLGLNRLQFDRKGIRGSLHYIWRQPWVAQSRDLSEIVETLWCRYNRWHNLMVEAIFSYSKRALHVKNHRVRLSRDYSAGRETGAVAHAFDLKEYPLRRAPGPQEIAVQRMDLSIIDCRLSRRQCLAENLAAI